MAALEDAPLLGLATNGRFLRDLVDHDRFRQATLHTALLDEWAAAAVPMLRRPAPADGDWQLAAAVFAGAAGWRATSAAGFDLTLACNGETRTLRVESTGGMARVGAGETAMQLHLQPAERGRLRYTMDGITRHAILHREGSTLHLSRDAAVFVFREASPFPAAETRHDPGTARAAVAGTIARIEVAAGDAVAAGQTLAVIEAMKMEMRVTANSAGTVAGVRVRLGQQVAAGAVLVDLTLQEA
jgi:geranyl-CoA carboxylase alpha subunit